MNKRSFQIVRIAFLGLLAAALPSGARAEESQYSRAGRWETCVGAQYWTGDDIDRSIGPTLGFGYNFDEHFNLNLEGYIGDLRVTVDGVHGKGTIYTGQFNLDYNFNPGRFTPYLTAGVGVFNYDAKEHFSGPSAFNVAKTGFSYGGGAGVRWEIGKHWFMKGAFRVFGTSTQGASVLYGPEVAAGWKF